MEWESGTVRDDVFNVEKYLSACFDVINYQRIENVSKDFLQVLI